MKQAIIRVITGPLQTSSMNQNPQPVNQIKVGNKAQQDKLKVSKLDNNILSTKTDGWIDREDSYQQIPNGHQSKTPIIIYMKLTVSNCRNQRLRPI